MKPCHAVGDGLEQLLDVSRDLRDRLSAVNLKLSKSRDTIAARTKRHSDEAYRKRDQERRIKVTKVVNGRTIKQAHRRHSAWSDYEDAYLAKNHESMRYVDIAKELNRTYCAIKTRVAKLRRDGVVDAFDATSPPA